MSYGVLHMLRQNSLCACVALNAFPKVQFRASIPVVLVFKHETKQLIYSSRCKLAIQSYSKSHF